MKYLHVIMLLFLFNCNDQQKEKIEQIESITEVDYSVINSLKAFVGNIETSGRGEEESTVTFEKIKELDNYILDEMPIYEIDIDCFYEDPSPESLIKSLYKSETKKVFVGVNRKNTDDKILLQAKYRKGIWWPD